MMGSYAPTRVFARAWADPGAVTLDGTKARLMAACQEPFSLVRGSNRSPSALTQVQASIGFVPARNVTFHILRC